MGQRRSPRKAFTAAYPMKICRAVPPKSSHVNGMFLQEGIRKVEVKVWGDTRFGCDGERTIGKPV